jgi:sugar/nucleoside kinase (ribokinase family)
MDKTFDCVICGSCVADILVRPFPVSVPVGAGRLFEVEPIEVTVGGCVSNTGIAMARLGRKVAAFSYVGNDVWAPILRERLQAEGVDTSRLLTHPTAATSTSAALIDESGERSFAHCVGAPRQMDQRLFLDNLDLFARSRMTLVGYYGLMPTLEPDLPEIMAAIRAVGCRTALDASGSGGALSPLDRILPHLDVYVPSLAEAATQTGQSDPRKILDVFRNCGASGLLGVKLGTRGALLSPAAGEFIDVPCGQAPGPVVDTTGAGDAFYAGLLVGLLQGMDVAQAGRLAAAAGACCVTGLGATAGLRNYEETSRLAQGQDAR